MKINVRSLEFLNCLIGNRVPPILFCVPGKKEKLSPSDYQYYKVGTPEEWPQFIDAISHIIKG
eukprot:6765523-Ditylum_brightwellii.AAC.1